MTMAQQYMTYGSYDTEYGREYVYPSQRMYVHSSVYLPNSEIDPRTGLLRADPPRRGRTQAMRMEYSYLDKEYKQLDEALKRRMEQPGIRVSLRSGILLIALMAFVLGLLLLSQQGTLAERQKALNRMNKSVEECAKTNDALAAQITEASDSSTICYAAARDLNMIPAEAAEAIHLVAMDTRPLESAGPANPGTLQGSAQNQLASTEETQTVEAQTTMVPTLASGGMAR